MVLYSNGRVNHSITEPVFKLLSHLITRYLNFWQQDVSGNWVSGNWNITVFNTDFDYFFLTKFPTVSSLTESHRLATIDGK